MTNTHSTPTHHSTKGDDNGGGKKKDYVVVIEATEVGDPTAGLSFRVVNGDVTDLTVSLIIENPSTGQQSQWQPFYFQHVNAGELVAVCQAFSYAAGDQPTSVKISVEFSNLNEDIFTLASVGGINASYTTDPNPITNGNTFTNPNVPVGTPPYHPLEVGGLYFIQCLEESVENLAFLSGDVQTKTTSMKQVYTSQEEGMTWVLRQNAGEQEYYFELYDSQSSDYLYGDTANGDVDIQSNYTTWSFLPGSSSGGDNNFYQLECMNNEGSKKYLTGDTSTGLLLLAENLDTNNRAMKWYFHRLNQIN